MRFYSGAEMISELENGKEFEGTNFYRNVSKLYFSDGKLYSDSTGAIPLCSVFLEREWIMKESIYDSKTSMSKLLYDNNIILERYGTKCKTWYTLMNNELVRLHIKSLGTKNIATVYDVLSLEEIQEFFEHEYTISNWKLSELILYEE